MKIKTLTFLFIITIMLLPLISSIGEGVSVKFKIIPFGVVESEKHPYENPSLEYNIVGDSFYYQINFTAKEDLNDTLNITVKSANGKILDSRSKHLDLINGTSISFIPNSTRKGYYLAMPFDVVGDYEIKICSNKELLFQREYRVWLENYSPPPRSVWYNGCTSYFFDVISQTQFSQYNDRDKTNEKNLSLSRNMLALTEKMLFITGLLMVLELVSLWSHDKSRKTLKKIIYWVMGLLMFFIIGVLFWVGTKMESPWNVISIGTALILGIWIVLMFAKVRRELQ
ncbi:MAG: hypothetical protein ABIB79_03750 [archaeon]